MVPQRGRARLRYATCGRVESDRSVPLPAEFSYGGKSQCYSSKPEDVRLLDRPAGVLFFFFWAVSAGGSSHTRPPESLLLLPVSTIRPSDIFTQRRDR